MVSWPRWSPDLAVEGQGLGSDLRGASGPGRGVCPGAGELTAPLGPTDGRLPLAPRGDVFTFEEAKSLQPEKQRGRL